MTERQHPRRPRCISDSVVGMAILGVDNLGSISGSPTAEGNHTAPHTHYISVVSLQTP